MASINAIQDSEVTYITGINAGGVLVSQSFWTWNSDSPATYGGTNYTAKFGPGTAGTGATISYAFDTASAWSVTEKAAFASTAALWSSVANISFVETGPSGAQIMLSRGNDDTASGGQNRFVPGQTGTTNMGTASRGSIEIDTSVEGFGPLGGAFSEYGGYPYTTLVHEWGHVLGLGHGGPYDEGVTDNAVAYTAFDNRAYSIMSYLDPPRDFSWGTSRASNGLNYRNDPTTPMMLDIVAIQRMYGVAVNTPLSGGQTYGFNSNIGGEIGKYFDFTQNSRPIVTIWNKGANNTLDLSGFGTASNVNLNDGSFSSVAGLSNNLAIAFGTRIDTAITGSGNDAVAGNNNGNFILGGAGSDSITGGQGNDHLYGGGIVAVAGDGADNISGGSGNDYIQGNAGDDQLHGESGSDRIQGGQGNDSVAGGAGNDTANGNLGNDTIDGGANNDSLRGGQGNDSLAGGSENDVLQGDLGTDNLAGGSGIDMLTGGSDADIFIFNAGDAAYATSGGLANMTDMIADFTDGIDRIRLSQGVPASVLQGQAFGDFTSAASAAQQMLGSQGSSNVAALRVGNDSFLFYDTGPSAPLEAIKLAGFSNPALIGTADFA
ncbi:M10 family metallopeptidase C-terminal domain-containing protein [Rhizorhabdus dicambivorans]|uniref:Peptidase M10, serralysin-like protein n=1 Tax=Rhizorhabdus dicambivorans TaxID=1850238 RepID=A0A2A4G1B3_9SPHN|nr:M10 family metallopeptidase C-terminal domain-containing protein [Rhizorhabdus dicambivorans]ATE65006.1 peptidase M10, serralysin-like protein [Rhizorhabdus dicambivorans]PCE44279.1 peptidase M10, serralysin-like protein [Rhizorhabdus dicambivorans]